MMQKRAPHIAALFFTLLTSSLLLTGCGDLVEIQDRDFVLAVGVSYQNEQFQVTYSLPDLGKVTEQSSSADQSSLLRSYEGKSLPELEQCYNFNSESRLDYRHLQVIILDASICSNANAMKDFLTQVNDNYDISHNVLVYYYESGVKELMGMDGVNGSIGEHLKKLNNNNHINGMEPAKIGTLIDCLANKRTLFIPALFSRDNSIAVDGGILFRENHMLTQLSQLESDYYFISLGKSNDYLIRLTEKNLIQLQQIKAKTKFTLTDKGPEIHLTITGSAKPLPGNAPELVYPIDQTNHYIREQIILQLMQYMKTDGIDYLNFYDKTSYQSRQTWIRYQNQLSNFIHDATINVSVDIRYE